MTIRSLLRLGRPIALTLLLLGILVLGAQPAAWATPAQRPPAQTLPSMTPGGAPDTTATPTNTQVSSTSTPTATPRGRRHPTPTPTTNPTSTSVSQPGPGTPTSTSNNQGQNGNNQGQNGNNQGQNGNNQGQNGNSQGSNTGNQPGLPSFPCTVRPPNPDPAAPRATRESADSNTSNTLLNCPWSLVIAPGDLSAAGAFEMKLINPAASQPANAGERFFGSHVELTFFDANGQAIPHPTFARPITLCYNYSAADLAPIGDPAQFAIELFNTTTQQWDRLPTTLDTANSRVCTTLPHLSLYAVAARVPVPGALPRTGDAGEAGSAIWLWGLVALGAGAGVSLWARRAQRATQPGEARER